MRVSIGTSHINKLSKLKDILTTIADNEHNNEHNKHDFYPHGPSVVGETHFNKSLYK